MKKIISILSIFLIAAIAMPASAAEAFSSEAQMNYSDSSVTVSGNIGRGGECVLITDENPTGDIKIQHRRSVITSDDGSFSYTYKVNPENGEASGIHTVYITSIGNTVGECTYYYEEKNALTEKIRAFLNADEASLKIYLEDEEYKELFGVTNHELFKEVDKETLAKACAPVLNKVVINENLQTTVDEVSDILLTHSLLWAYAGNKAELLYKDGEMLYADIIKADMIDSTYNVTAYNIYNGILSNEGKRKVTDYLLGRTYADLTAFHKALIEKTLLISLTNAKQNGYGHVKSILTSQNMNALGISFSRSITDSDAAAVAAKGTDFSTAAELQSFLKALPNKNNNNSGGSSSSKGSGSGGGYSVDKNITEPEIKPSNNEAFSDLENVLWAKEAIYALYKKGIISGTGDKKFSPESTLLREQIAKILCISMQLTPKNGASNFADADENEWYAPYINALFENGLIKGKDEKTFGVGDAVTREELCTMIYRAMPELFKNNNSETVFTDDSDISDYSREAVYALFNEKIINGYSDGSFLPKNNSTRAEAAKIVYSTILKSEGK